MEGSGHYPEDSKTSSQYDWGKLLWKQGKSFSSACKMDTQRRDWGHLGSFQDALKEKGEEEALRKLLGKRNSLANSANFWLSIERVPILLLSAYC